LDLPPKERFKETALAFKPHILSTIQLFMRIIPDFVEGIFKEFGPQIQEKESEAYEEIQGIAEALDYDFT